MIAILIIVSSCAVISFGLLIYAFVRLDQAHKAYVEARYENRYHWHWSNN